MDTTTLDDSGLYVCMGRNGVGTVYARQVQVYIKGKLEIHRPRGAAGPSVETPHIIIMYTDRLYVKTGIVVFVYIIFMSSCLTLV